MLVWMMKRFPPYCEIAKFHEVCDIMAVTRKNHQAKDSWVKKCNIVGVVVIAMLYMFVNYSGPMQLLSYIRLNKL